MKLEVKNICKSFNENKAVDNVNFEIENGVYGLLGANGAGKTTLMRMICTLLEPTSGSIKYNNENIKDMDERYRELLGYLPQKFGYYPDFSAEDYLLYIGSLKGLKSSYAKKKAKELLNIVSLWESRKKKIKTFSGGMKRRLGIAQAIMNDPKILILDEPTAGLDPKERIHFRNLISELGKDKIILLSTHIVSDIESIANEILIMKKGNIIEKGSVEKLLTIIENNVWSIRTKESQIHNIENKYIVTNMKTENNEIIARVISKNKPDYDATLKKATLEDLFMYYFGEEEK